jgi:hypothetical protein
MYMKKKSIFICVLIISSVFLFAQEAVFAPFVSRLTIEAKNNLIRLMWKDSVDVKGPVYIYRSETPFENSFAPLPPNPVTVPYGIGSYIDEIEEPGTWHYMVVSSDANGKRYEVAIPLGNIISVLVNQGLVGELSVTQEQPQVSQRAPVTGIQSISASVHGDAVSITFRTDGSTKTPVLYRSVNELRNPQDLLRAVIVQSGVKSPFVDYPVPGISYYYSIVFEEDLSQGNIHIQPGINATLNPVEIPMQTASGAQGTETRTASVSGTRTNLRSMPLPIISTSNLVSGINNLPELPSPIPLSEEAAKAASEIAGDYNREQFRKYPKAFAEDMNSGTSEGDYALKTIVQGSFANRDWPSTKNELLQYLSMPRSAEAEARARFYLGQSYYFTASAQEALFEFLMVQNTYEKEAAEWIQASLAMLNTK